MLLFFDEVTTVGIGYGRAGLFIWIFEDELNLVFIGKFCDRV